MATWPAGTPFTKSRDRDRASICSGQSPASRRSGARGVEVRGGSCTNRSLALVGAGYEQCGKEFMVNRPSFRWHAVELLESGTWEVLRGGGWAPASAGTVVRGGGPPPRVLNSKLVARTVIVEFDAAEPPLKAELIYTSDTRSQWSKRQWRSVPAPFSGNRIEVTLPNEAHIYYVSLWDVRGFQVSTCYSLDY